MAHVLLWACIAVVAAAGGAAAGNKTAMGNWLTSKYTLSFHAIGGVPSFTSAKDHMYFKSDTVAFGVLTPPSGNWNTEPCIEWSWKNSELWISNRNCPVPESLAVSEKFAYVPGSLVNTGVAFYFDGYDDLESMYIQFGLSPAAHVTLIVVYFVLGAVVAVCIGLLLLLWLRPLLCPTCPVPRWMMTKPEMEAYDAQQEAAADPAAAGQGREALLGPAGSLAGQP